MTEKTYTNDELDVEVTDAIGQGYAHAGEIERFVYQGHTNHTTMRSIDRTLQRLRKRGIIELVGKPRRWTLTTQGRA